MSRPTSLRWFASHEARLAWRDWLTLITAGRRRRASAVFLGIFAFVVFMHGIAYLMLSSSIGALQNDDRRLLIAITASIVLASSTMVAQALEWTTRVFFGRGDLELILSSPVDASRLFTVRLVAIAGTILSTSLAAASPFINTLAWLGGPRWLCAYPAAAALSLIAVALAAPVIATLFYTIGAKRTRLVAQVLAALTGAAFAIGLQFAAIFSFGTLAVPRWLLLERLAPDLDSVVWTPARAVLGEPTALALLLGVGIAAISLAVSTVGPRFGALALGAMNIHTASTRKTRRRWPDFHRSPAQALRWKEWTLVLRDPWLISQTLMQLLYLAPGAYLLWRNFFTTGGAPIFFVPVIIMTAGQLSGGLAWLMISAEDAPDLIASAPISSVSILRAKIEAALGGVTIILSPFAIMLAIASPTSGLVSLLGALIAATSAIAIQYWFRTREKRSRFRRRQTSSRLALYAEALTSVGWAATGALAASGSLLALFSALCVLAILIITWLMHPSR